jgi:hypothetical protein
MVLTWCYGMNGLMTGCAVLSFLRDGTVPEVSEVMQRAQGGADFGDLVNVNHAVLLQSMHQLSRVTFPINIAQVLLSALLVFASGLAMGSRKGARALVLQAILANAVLACVAYALTQGVRAACVDAVLRVVQSFPADLPNRAVALNPEVYWFGFRMRLVVFELGTLALGALALTRGRTRVYFDAMAKAAESAEEP